MMIGWSRFNIYLLLLAMAVSLCGCQSAAKKREKQTSTLRVHLEVNPDASKRSAPVPIYRERPVLINVQSAPFLTESEITRARILDVVGGFVIEVQFNQRGTYLLEQYTASNPGKYLVTFVEFGERLQQSRWLGATVISQRIRNGALAFTPDATREECEEIVLGLNNVAREVEKRSKW